MSEEPAGYMDDGANAPPPMPKYAEVSLPPGLFANSNKLRIQGNAVCNQCGKDWWPTKGTPKRCRWCNSRRWAK